MNKIYIDKLTKKSDKRVIINSIYINDSLDIEFIYKSTFKNTKDLRDFLEIIWDVLWFSCILKWRIILISDELNNNAIEYWSSSDWYNILRIRTKKENWLINFNLEVEDNWKWRASKSALDMETMRAHKLKLWYFWHNSIRWRWLFLIIVKLVDRLYFKNAVNWWLIVWVKMKI